MVRAEAPHVANGPCDALLARVDGDEQIFAELCDLFLDDTPNRLASIRNALTAQDGLALQAAAHAFKGAASVFDAEAVVATARRLERLAADGNLGDADETCNALEALSRALIDEIRATRQSMAQSAGR